MKILVTGANGLLGQTLVRQLTERGYEVVATGRGVSRLIIAAMERCSYQSIDITNGVQLQELIAAEKPEVIVHAAAMTQVDYCEEHKQECYNLNVTATRFLIDATKEINARLIYVSTDFVFDGTSGPYAEDAEPSPVNYYGSTKFAAEKAVMESGLEWAIARTILVYGFVPSTGRQNIISWVKQSLEESKIIRVVIDQYRTPTFVEDLARGVLLMIEKKARGIYHLSGEQVMTPYEMAVETARFFGLNESLIEKTGSAEFKQSGTRPLKTGFNIAKAKKDLGFQPLSFEDGLQNMFIGQPQQNKNEE